MSIAKSPSDEYPHLVEKFEEITKSKSSKPFSIEIGGKKVFFYLSRPVNKDYMKKTIHKLHKCNACTSRIKHLGGLFGPEGYAISFGGLYDSRDIFLDLEKERELHKDSLSTLDTFFITEKNLKLFPKFEGKNPEGERYHHLYINLGKDMTTKGEMASKIDAHSTSYHMVDPAHFASEARLEKIITVLQETSNGNPSFMDLLENAMDSPDLKRKHFWKGHMDYIKELHEYSSTFANGKVWSEMDDISKAHVRIFSHLNGCGTGNQSVKNLRFKGAGQIIDCFTDVPDVNSLVPFMNSRSDPETYMVQQVSREIQRHSVKSRYKVSLAWSVRDDLDLWVKTERGEMIGYSHKKSRDGHTKLDFDANAGNTSTSPVENITLSDQNPGKYKIYVNNYASRTPTDTSFTVVVNLDGYEQVFEDLVWPNSKPPCRGTDSNGMIYVTTVCVTRDMISSKGDIEMSSKQARKFDNIKGEFLEKFGLIKSQIVNMEEVEEAIVPSKEKSTIDFLSNLASKNKKSPEIKTSSGRVKTRAEIARDAQMSNMRKFTNFEDVLPGFVTSSIDIQVHGRDFPPTYLTTPSCKENVKFPIVVNTYYEEGAVPRKPDADTRKDVCRYNNEWNTYGCSFNWSKVKGVLKITRPDMNGYFLSMSGVKLPMVGSQDWSVGGGMYSTDLKSEFHLYRDIWQSHHAMTRPTLSVGNRVPAIGVFLHVGKTYMLKIDGTNMSVKV